ncbi:hypothetical protein QR680_004792 [Steinernema hermaphroditum]|uniref:Uncharacterized protein n=1 Tax=Steinernema hermaphroditum TaxID=289476 RepID=A0AA39HR92_9BILA|nr:hypothetical protein QR680_004792 [Steinernema hermaphroditum]
MPNSKFLIFCVSLLLFFIACAADDSGYPKPAIYDITKVECERHCTSMLSSCRQQTRGFVCEMDSTLLAVIIVMAILTGVLVPVLCISLYVCGIFAYISHRLSKLPDDEEMLNDDKRRNRGSHEGTMETKISEKPTRSATRHVDFSDSSVCERSSDEDRVYVEQRMTTNYRSMSERPTSERVMV